MFEFNESLPTVRELEKRYKVEFKDGKFPLGAFDNCCAKDEYISDFISHRMGYHKISRKQTLEELDEFMMNLYKNHKQQLDDLK